MKMQMPQFGKRRREEPGTGAETVDSMTDVQVLDMHRRKGGSLLDNLMAWANAAQHEHDPGRSTVLKDLFTNIQSDVNSLSNSDRGSKMTFENVSEYVATKMRAPSTP